MKKEYKLGAFVDDAAAHHYVSVYAPMITALLGSDQPQLLIQCDTREHARNTRIAAYNAVKRAGMGAQIGTHVRGTDVILYKK